MARSKTQNGTSRSDQTSTVVEVPPDITTPQQLRVWQVAMKRKHGTLRYRTPPVDQHRRLVAVSRTAAMPFVELPPEFAVFEQKVRDRTGTEDEYQSVVARSVRSMTRRTSRTGGSGVARR